MGYAKIKLKFKNKSYSVEVDETSTPQELSRLFAEKLELKGDYYLVPVNSFGLIDGSIWELKEKGKNEIIASFKEDT